MKSLLVFNFLLLLFLDGLEANQRPSCVSGVEEPKGRVDTSERLQRLRKEFKRPPDTNPIDGYIITNYDEHQSKELEERDRRLEYISGFPGKNGVAIVTKDKSVIWVDDNEKIQAEEMISCDWTIYSLNNPELSMEDWLLKNIRSYHQRIGIDPTLIPYNFLSEDIRKKIKFVNIKHNMIDSIWIERPPSPKLEANMIEETYTGKSWNDKINEVRKALKEENCDAMVFTALDEIAWVLNIRAMHVNHVPVVKAYLLISESRVDLFTHLKKLDRLVNITLLSKNCYNTNCVRLNEYHSIMEEMRTFTQIWRRFCIPAADKAYPGANRAIFESISPDHRMIRVSPILKLKSIKNMNERAGMKNAHIRDASVFCDIMGYLEDKIKRENMNEEKVKDFIDQMRKEQALSTGLSYETMVAFGNHTTYNYHVRNNTAMTMNFSSVFIVDSGGQYLDGTTSVARTFHLGTPTAEQIDSYTRVLKALIDYSSLVFPESLQVYSTDIIARIPIWKGGYNYEHPTGTSIGAHLAAEEGPILIDGSYKRDETFHDGNFITVGPSFSKKGDFGIKLKNVLEVEKIETEIKKGLSEKTEKRLKFKTTTLIPFEMKLINVKLLSPEQIMWLNEYNERIRDEVGAQLKLDRRWQGFNWLVTKAQDIPDKFLDRTSNSNSLAFFQNKAIFTAILTFTIFQFV